MKFLFYAEMSHAISCTIINQGDEVLKHAHASTNLVGVHRKHAHNAYVWHLVDFF